MSKTQPIIPCDDRCMFAKGDDCDCYCGGANHKQGFRLPAHMREQHRTRVGRRIMLLNPGTPDFVAARNVLRMRDKLGMSQRDIAAELNVSPPTVRRMITRYLHTLAAMDAQKAARAA